MNKGHYTQEAKLVHLYARVDIGASGAPTLDVDDSKGIASITRTSAGLYELTLSQVWNKLMALDVFALDASLQDLTFQIKSINLTTKKIELWSKAAAVATDPASGADLYIKLVMKDSSV